MVTVKAGAVALWADVEDRACILGAIEGARENLDHAAATAATTTAYLRRGKS